MTRYRNPASFDSQDEFDDYLADREDDAEGEAQDADDRCSEPDFE